MLRFPVMTPPEDAQGTPPALKPETPLASFFDKRPPLPPAPLDGKWTWTKAKLKAVYLEALTDLEKTTIAAAVGVDRKTLFSWRRHADYRRYLATLVLEDGLADRVERIKGRKTLSEKLFTKLSTRLDKDLADGEKLAPLLKAHKDLLQGLQEDADDLGEKLKDAAPAEGPRRSFDLVERVNGIADPVERETVKRHLLAMLREHLDGRAGPDVPIDAEGLPPETPGPATATTSAAPPAPPSRMLDNDGQGRAEAPEQAAPAALTADALDDHEEPAQMPADALDAGEQRAAGV
jgi:hypothetical protein